MSVKRISPTEAKELMDGAGYVYLDVRSIPEFEQGHPEGAYNVPLLHMTPGGMQPNPDFMDVVSANFDREAKIIIGCRAGSRSLRAAEMLQQVGYTHVIDQRAGYVGATDAFGQLQEPGWQPEDLPVATEPQGGRGYSDLAAKAGKA